MVRNIDDVLTRPFVAVARAKGATRHWVLWRHVAKNALLPTLTIAGVLFGDLIAGVTEELKVHRAYARELGINLESVCLSPACGAYTDFLLRTAWQASLAEIVAAMTPCMRLYAYLGGELARTCGPQHPYRRWIEAYSGEEFQGLAKRLEELLDRVGADRSVVRDGYRYALECELDFFTAALTA